MPYQWTAVHDVTYVEPPGYMEFVDDWGLNLVYDEVNNPNPPNDLLFITRMTPKNNASVSLKWGIPFYFDIGYLWLRWYPIFDLSFREAMVLENQFYYGSNFIRAVPFDYAAVPVRNQFPGVELNFNPAMVSSVRLVVYSRPTWVDP